MPPWARLHALALLYSGGVGIGDERRFFSLGGFVQQDILRALFLNRPQGCCTYLRGYDPGFVAGDQYHLLSVEYRAPLLWFERSKDTFPVYLRRLNGAIFGDAGDAFFGSLKFGNLHYGAGAELRLETHLIYYIDAEIMLGFAHGFSDQGGNHAYLVFSFPF